MCSLYPGLEGDQTKEQQTKVLYRFCRYTSDTRHRYTSDSNTVSHKYGITQTRYHTNTVSHEYGITKIRYHTQMSYHTNTVSDSNTSDQKVYPVHTRVSYQTAFCSSAFLGTCLASCNNKLPIFRFPPFSRMKTSCF